MFVSRPAMALVVVSITLACSGSYAGERKIIFADDFNRRDAETVGNEWSSKGAAVLKDGAAFFKTKEEEFRPRMRHVFPAQKQGKFRVSFVMDWLRTSEGTWSFFMQLGNRAALPRSLVYDTDLAKGIGVNLVWGGGEHVDFQKPGSFGYMKEGRFKPLFVANNLKMKESVVDKAVVTIDVDVDAGTYSVRFNGKAYPDIPFDNKGPVDTIRFMTNGCSATGFSKSSIDDVLISKQQ